MSFRIPLISFLSTLLLPVISSAEEAGKVPAVRAAEGRSVVGRANPPASQTPKRPASASSGDVAPLPTWDDTMIRSDVLLLPAATQSSPAGYFPTRNDLSVLGDRDYPRAGGAATGSEIGPDAVMQNATGIFPYASGEQDFYTRHSSSFRGANRVLGLFTTHQAITYEPEIYPGLAVTMDGSVTGSIFTRTFDPNKAHVKLGPLALDVMWIGAGAIWSDYRGPVNFTGANEDGWVGYIDLALRGYFKITDSFYLSWAASLIYLPGSNELAFQTLNGNWPQLGFEIFYQKQVKAWSIYLGDQFFARTGIDIFSDLDLRGQDQAGRYMFGYYGRSTGAGFFETDNVFFVNSATAEATRMIGASDWRFWAKYQHVDFWQTFGFDNYQFRDFWELAAAYEGNVLPFAPRLSYSLTAFDGYDVLFHQVQLQLTGRLTENVTIQGMIGYLWTSSTTPSYDTLLWSLNLNHRFSQRGSHGFLVGQQFFTDSYSPEAVLATNYQYYVNYQLMRRLQASAYAQYSYGDRVVTAFNTTSRGYYEGFLTGTSLEFQLFDYTRLVAMAAFQRSDGDMNLERTDRWIYRLQLQQQLLTRLSLQCGYQYETSNGIASFDEHMVNISVRRYF